VLELSVVRLEARINGVSWGKYCGAKSQGDAPFYRAGEVVKGKGGGRRCGRD
jgi:hypothetical protein